MIIGNFALVFGCSALILLMLRTQLKLKEKVVGEAFQIVADEANQKKEILSDLSGIAAGMTTPEDLGSLDKEREEAEAMLAEKRAEFTTLEEEQRVVESRLREIEELEREMESNSIEAQKELELLQSQEKLMHEETEKLRQRLNSSMETLEQLLKELSSSQVAVDKLTAAKTELVNTENKMDFYSEEISRLNSQYMELKKAYDALDIEYAQLYERQNSVL